MKTCSCRWIFKSDNDVVNIADEVKCRLHRIANLLTNKDALSVVDDFRNWGHFKGKIKNWLKVLGHFIRGLNLYLQSEADFKAISRATSAELENKNRKNLFAIMN